MSKVDDSKTLLKLRIKFLSGKNNFNKFNIGSSDSDFDYKYVIRQISTSIHNIFLSHIKDNYEFT